MKTRYRVKILLLEDDALFNETLCEYLESEGYEVDGVRDPRTALELVYRGCYDLYLLDIRLPFEDGITFLRALRASGDQTPAVFVTSKEGLDAMREGFGCGGDDYLTKPFDLEELSLRIEALLRRQIRNRRVDIGTYRFDTQNGILYDQNEAPMPLTPKASILLRALLEADGTFLSHETLMRRLWSASEEGSETALRVYVAQLKKFFGERIQNKRGVGYRLVRRDENA